MENESLVAALSFSVTITAAAMAIITIIAHVIRAAKTQSQNEEAEK